MGWIRDREEKTENMANQPPPYPGHEKSSQGYPSQADQYHMPPQPGYGQSPAPVVVQHQYVAPRMFGPTPINMQCPNCRAQVTTVESHNSDIRGGWRYCMDCFWSHVCSWSLVLHVHSPLHGQSQGRHS